MGLWHGGITATSTAQNVKAQRVPMRVSKGPEIPRDARDSGFQRHQKTVVREGRQSRKRRHTWPLAEVKAHISI